MEQAASNNKRGMNRDVEQGGHGIALVQDTSAFTVVDNYDSETELN